MSVPPSPWRKSSYSTDHPSNCVEVAALGQIVAARDSRDASGPVLDFTKPEWRAFLDEVKSGALDFA
ncbi:DUF397 domain-containing protein [Spirillospora sp. NPDC048819]|uniref:DUF397 domain-containing protein n=1 Tax=Spirillospora sp. NPDC048819 TaxID=3155268 RepID=UPI003407B783